jgi:proline dehydrogenase
MDEALLKQASLALRKAALNEEAKAYILSNPILFNLLKKAADRYIGGDTLEETIQKAKLQNSTGMRCSIEFMGESTRTVSEANEARNEFLRICKVIKNENLGSSVALDLSHIGLAVSKDLCLENLDLICKEAKSANTYVAISAENVERTDDVLDTYQRISKIHPNVAITLQAYLHRTKDDFPEMMKLDGRIVIVKGAFETPPGHSLPRGPELDEAYLSYVEKLLASNHPCSIATNGVKEIDSTVSNEK